MNKLISYSVTYCIQKDTEIVKSCYRDSEELVLGVWRFATGESEELLLREWRFTTERVKSYYWESEELLLGEWRAVTEGVKSSTWEREGQDGNTDVTTNILVHIE